MLILTPSSAIPETAVPAAAPLAGTDILVVSQNGAEVRTTLAALVAYATAVRP